MKSVTLSKKDWNIIIEALTSLYDKEFIELRNIKKADLVDEIIGKIELQTLKLTS